MSRVSAKYVCMVSLATLNILLTVSIVVVFNTGNGSRVIAYIGGSSVGSVGSAEASGGGSLYKRIVEQQKVRKSI